MKQARITKKRFAPHGLVRIFSVLVVAFFMVLLIAKPAVYMNAVTEGLKLFVIAVLPALFPFFFFSKLLTSLDVATQLAKFTKKPLRYLFNAPDAGGYIWVMSMLCGYPVGAKLVADCYETGIISEEECKSLIAFTSTSGPLFVLGTVASGMLGSYAAGAVILLTHYAGALLNGILFKNKRACETQTKTAQKRMPVSYDNLLSDAVNSSIFSVLAVGAYIAIFNMAVVALSETGALGAVSALFAKISVPPALTEGVLSGLVEMTRGALLLSQSGYALQTIIPLLAAVISFGGISVTLQSVTFLSKCKIKTGAYLVRKFSQALITFVLASIVCYFAF